MGTLPSPRTMTTTSMTSSDTRCSVDHRSLLQEVGGRVTSSPHTHCPISPTPETHLTDSPAVGHHGLLRVKVVRRFVMFSLLFLFSFFYSCFFITSVVRPPQRGRVAASRVFAPSGAAGLSGRRALCSVMFSNLVSFLAKTR